MDSGDISKYAKEKSEDVVKGEEAMEGLLMGERKVSKKSKATKT